MRVLLLLHPTSPTSGCARNSLDVVIQQRFVNSTSPYRVCAHNASLQPAPGGDYELLIPASGTSPQELISHLMIPLDPGRRLFSQGGR